MDATLIEVIAKPSDDLKSPSRVKGQIMQFGDVRDTTKHSSCFKQETAELLWEV